MPPYGTIATMEMWKDLADGDEDFQNKFARVFDNTYVKEDGDWFTPDSMFM